MRSIGRKSAQGQSVIVLVVSLTALLGFVGLALDGSNVYLQRRCQQNAADSGAFAGAREMVGDKQATNGSVLAQVKQYVTSSGGDPKTADIEYVSASGKLGPIDSYNATDSSPSAANGVYVKSSRTFAVFFAGMLGQRTKKAEAQATVVFGPSASALFDNSVFPVAIQQSVITAVKPGELIDIWDTDKVTDVNGNPLGGERGWLNLNFVYSQTDPNSRITADNFSDSELRTWAQYGKTPPVQVNAGTINGNDGDFINGDSGTRNAAIQAAQTRIGQVVLVPVYDRAVDAATMAATLPSPTGGFSNGNYYHVVAFAKFLISNTVTVGSDKVIQGSFLSSVLGEGKVLPPSSANFQSNETNVSLALTDNP